MMNTLPSNMGELVAKLHAIQPQDKINSLFKDIADILMNHTIIKASDKKYRLAEIEFYYFKKGAHEDYYIHAINKTDKGEDKLSDYSAKHQLTSGKFYFHYSGMDITIGGNNKDNPCYGGILIRSVLPVEGEVEDTIIGPLKTKNELLNAYIDGEAQDFIRHEQDETLAKMDIEEMIRVGLNPNTGGRADFRNRPYRFVLKCIQNKVKKE